MVISEENCALEIMFQQRILNQGSVDVIFGSDFPLDNSEHAYLSEY